MTMTDPKLNKPLDILSDKAAYLAAQKRRNLFIALGLFGFVVMVFLVSIIRMAEASRPQG
jgi:hypothetical protein